METVGSHVDILPRKHLGYSKKLAPITRMDIDTVQIIPNR